MNDKATFKHNIEETPGSKKKSTREEYRELLSSNIVSEE